MVPLLSLVFIGAQGVLISQGTFLRLKVISHLATSEKIICFFAILVSNWDKKVTKLHIWGKLSSAGSDLNQFVVHYH